jgi:hypothetical protein
MAGVHRPLSGAPRHDLPQSVIPDPNQFKVALNNQPTTDQNPKKISGDGPPPARRRPSAVRVIDKLHS